MQLNYAEGCYNLSFFNIKISTDEPISEDTLKKEKSTFLHEFIHYLQDLVLPYNIRYNLSYVRFFQNILDCAYNNGVIYRPFSMWTSDSLVLWEQLCRTFGKCQVVNKVSEIGDATSEYITTSGFDSNLNINRMHRVYQYSIPVLNTGNSNTIQYGLGARDLLEYIAYKIEKKNNPNRPPAPQLPYHSVDLLFNKYNLSEIPDEVRLCIAERCLYNDAPIHFFLNTLLGTEESREYIKHSRYDEIYKYLLSLDTMTRDGHCESLTDKTQRRLYQFTKELQFQYSGFGEIVKWLQKVSRFVKEKLSGRFLFSDLYQMSANETSQFIHDVISSIGVPMIMNSKEEAISIHTDEFDNSDFIQFYILQEFVAFVRNKETKCPIYEFCKANLGLCNGNCTLNEQMTIHANENCYYRKFLNTYKLLGVKFN